MGLKPEYESFSIRPAEAEDIAGCCQLETAYKTDYVWQMQFQENARSIQSVFTQVRLPRTMPVAYPYGPQHLAAMFERADFLFVASFHDEIIGCISGAVENWRQTVRVNVLIVQPQVRHKGVGKMLLKAAKELATQNNCKRLAAAVQTKNYGAIQFAHKQGFAFCGYNDKYFPNGDIALNFSLAL